MFYTLVILEETGFKKKKKEENKEVLKVNENNKEVYKLYMKIKLQINITIFVCFDEEEFCGTENEITQNTLFAAKKVDYVDI